MELMIARGEAPQRVLWIDGARAAEGSAVPPTEDVRGPVQF